MEEGERVTFLSQFLSIPLACTGIACDVVNVVVNVVGNAVATNWRWNFGRHFQNRYYIDLPNMIMRDQPVSLPPPHPML